jgi:hypothetical protein
MAKSSGLGDRFYLDGYDLSGDVASLDTISGGPAPLDMTTINLFANARIGGLRDGSMSFTSLFDYVAAPPPVTEHNALSTLDTTDQVCTYFHGGGIGNPAASCNAKQLNYDPTRGTDGTLTLKVDMTANGYGLEWGVELTPGIRTDSGPVAASAANSFDTGGSLAFGGQAYLQVFSVTGTSVTVAIWDSADNITFAAVAGLAFAAVTPAGAPESFRIAIANTATIRRYVAVATTGTFTNAQFAVMLHKNEVAGVTF